MSKPPISKIRRNYLLRLVGRIVILAVCIVFYFLYPEVFTVLDGFNFFKTLSPLQLLWIIWVIDMILQIIPIKNEIPLGSQKLFANRFRPIKEKINYKVLKNHVTAATLAAYKVMLLWAILISVIGILFFNGIFDKTALFMISVFFYVCDLICVLIWCPFRLIMKNKCCTTCRIFNWDHLMMFSPLIFIGGFYAISLVFLAITAWLTWELCIMIYPERFFEITNVALQCSECTDKLCTQYCKKLRKNSP